MGAGELKGDLLAAAQIMSWLTTLDVAHGHGRLFGDIFERDNLDWQSRELATVSMLAALPSRNCNRICASA